MQLANQTTIPQSSTRPWTMPPPPITPWGKADKKHQQDLINNGKVDIRCSVEFQYIDRIHVKFFRGREEKKIVATSVILLDRVSLRTT
jgi:hypothetical protein